MAGNAGRGRISSSSNRGRGNNNSSGEGRGRNNHNTCDNEQQGNNRGRGSNISYGEQRGRGRGGRGSQTQTSEQQIQAAGADQDRKRTQAEDNRSQAQAGNPGSVWGKNQMTSGGINNQNNPSSSSSSAVSTNPGSVWGKNQMTSGGINNQNNPSSSSSSAASTTAGNPGSVWGKNQMTSGGINNQNNPSSSSSSAVSTMAGNPGSVWGKKQMTPGGISNQSNPSSSSSSAVSTMAGNPGSVWGKNQMTPAGISNQNNQSSSSSSAGSAMAGIPGSVWGKKQMTPGGISNQNNPSSSSSSAGSAMAGNPGSVWGKKQMTPGGINSQSNPSNGSSSAASTGRAGDTIYSKPSSSAEESRNQTAISSSCRLAEKQIIPGTWAKFAPADNLFPGLTLQESTPPVPAMHVLLPEEDQPTTTLDPVPTTSIRPTRVATRRPGPGSKGRAVQVHANHFRVTFKPGVNICHYDVDIRPYVTSKAILRLLQRKLVSDYKSDFGGILTVYDGSKSLFAPKRLPFQCKEFQVLLKENEVEKSFGITVRHVATLNRNQLDDFLRGRLMDTPTEHLQALDIVLREFLIKHYTPVGRSFYTEDLGSKHLGGGLVAWNGFFQSLRPTSQSLALNVDMSTTVFYDSTLVTDFLEQMLGLRLDNPKWNDKTREQVKRALARLKIEVTHRKTPRKYRIMGLSPFPTRHTKFTLAEGGEMSIKDYFLQTYNYQLRYLDIPCIQVQGKSTSYLPMEVCQICKGQKYVGKLSDYQTTQLRDLACVKPQTRAGITEKIMMRPDGPGKGDFVTSFGMEVSRSMTPVQARILDPPKLRYGDNGGVRVVYPENGQWNLNKSCVVEGKTVSNWALISFDNRVNQNSARNFGFALAKRCSEVGVSLAKDPLIAPILKEKYDLEVQKLEATLEYTCNEARKAIQQQRKPGQLELLFCVFADKHPAYGDLKRICETKIGVITQCCLSKHLVPKPNRRTGQLELNSQYLANLALKINAKLGGGNNKLDTGLPQICSKVFDKPTLILGADVTHPSAGDVTSPSIAAVVGNIDWPSAIKYMARVRTQFHRKEIIEDLKEMVMELARGFRQRTGQMPERVIMFRDGVSEGQFDAVLQHEVNALKEAMAIVGGYNYNPRVTWVVVQKRHHTRFIPADRNQDAGGNILPGLVVDTIVTHPSQFDFFLCSHAGIKGTSKPTHYHVLHDDNLFSSDDLQGLINNLCYTYARCTRSLSVVPPAHYAHLAAYRARLHIETQDARNSVSSSGHHGSNGSLPLVVGKIQDAMYFC